VTRKPQESGPGRLLIVDDETELMTVLREMLASQGFDTFGYTSGEKALEFLEKEDIDILLTDMMMPGMDGITLLKKGLEIDPHLVGIIMTGQATVETAIEAMKLGAFDYITKPFKLKDVLSILRRAIEIRHLRLNNVHLKETIALHELSQTISYPLDMKYMIDKLADAALQQCRADEVSIMLPLEENPGALYVAAARGDHAQHILGAKNVVEDGIAGWVARNQEPLVLHGPVDDVRFKPNHPRPDIVSSLSIPMLVGDEPVGVLNLNITKNHRNFTPGDVKTLATLLGLIVPVFESSRLYKRMKDAEEKYRSIFENAVEGIYQVSYEGNFLTVNPGFAHMLGYDSPEDLVTSNMDIGRQYYVIPDKYEEFRQLIEARGEVRAFKSLVRRKDGRTIWVSDNARLVRQNKIYYEGFVEDITKRRLVEERQELVLGILQLLNRQDDLENLVHDILHLLKEHTGVEAIGIRLREGEDYPYYQVNGFPENFVKAEKYLCVRDNAGKALCDSDGKPVLECMCGNILRGRIDPSHPFFTEGGSFWRNNALHLFSSTSRENSRMQTRNRCNEEGYESVALVPLRSGDGTVGLLQFNDSRQDLFTLERIQFFEGIGASLGIAIARHQAEKTLKESEERYHVAIENANDGVGILMGDEHIYVNRKFLDIFGYETCQDIIGKPQSLVVHPDDREMVAKYGSERKKGGPVPDRYEFKGLRKDSTMIYVETSAARIAYGGEQCTLIYVRDVTERKHAEEELKDILDRLRATLGATVRAMACTVELRDPYTAGHQRRVASLARAIAEEMCLARDSIDCVTTASLIHDIGKIAVPVEILVKPTKLKSIEFDIIKTHSEAGYNILKDIDFPWPVAEIVLRHHEKLDGTGYPGKYKGKQISIEARILTVADVVEAMASHRPYRPALGVDIALAEIEKNKGILYDTEVVAACLMLFQEKGFRID